MGPLPHPAPLSALDIAFIDKEKAPDHDIDQDAPRKLEAITRIKLPSGYRAAELPDAIHGKRDYASFDQTYRMDNGELAIERTVVVLKKKVAQADWNYYAYTKAIGARRMDRGLWRAHGPPTSRNLPALRAPLPSAS